MKLALLRRYVVVAETLHFPRAAKQLGIPLASLYTSLDKLEDEVGHTLINREGTPRLTNVGELFLVEAQATVAAAPRPRRRRLARPVARPKRRRAKAERPS